MDRFDILRHIHARAAEFLGHGQAEQAHGGHFLPQRVGDAVIGDHLGFGRDQPFAHIAVKLIQKLCEHVGIHACGAVHCHDLQIGS